MKTMMNTKGTLVLSSARFLPAKGEKKPAVMVDVLCDIEGQRQWHLLMLDPVLQWDKLFAKNEQIAGGLTEGDIVTIRGVLTVPQPGEPHYKRAEPKHGTFIAYDKGKFTDWSPIGLERVSSAFPMPKVKPWDELPLAERKEA